MRVSRSEISASVTLDWMICAVERKLYELERDTTKKKAAALVPISASEAGGHQ